MSTAKYTAACDLGASNGRVILGAFDGTKVTLTEVHRFENGCINEDVLPGWDIRHLFREICTGLGKAAEAAKKEGGELISFGIDTWGVDFGLIGKDGGLIGTPRSYRAAKEEDMQRVFEKIPFPELFARTGNAPWSYNTVFQLCRRKAEGDRELEKAAHLLMTPDLLAYLLTGEPGSEYTIASTSMLLNTETKNWDVKLAERLGLPTELFTPVQRSGTVRGLLKKEIADEIGTGRIPCIAVGSHDTASAVAAIPGKGELAFCSSGTWSLIGVERETACLDDAVRDRGFTNEGTVQGGYRILNNLMGLYMIQECRKEWLRSAEKNTEAYSWAAITEAADQAEAFRSLINTEDPRFFHAQSMETEIRNYCLETGQPVPESMGQTARCIYESLALSYRKAFRDLQKIRGKKPDQFNFTGGGIQNRLLDRMAADACGCMVVTGPVEGAAIGNLLTQVMALGGLANVDEIRETVRNSVETEVFESAESGIWAEAAEKLEGLKAGTM